MCRFFQPGLYRGAGLMQENCKVTQTGLNWCPATAAIPPDTNPGASFPAGLAAPTRAVGAGSTAVPCDRAVPALAWARHSPGTVPTRAWQCCPRGTGLSFEDVIEVHFHWNPGETEICLIRKT